MNREVEEYLYINCIKVIVIFQLEITGNCLLYLGLPDYAIKFYFSCFKNAENHFFVDKMVLYFKNQETLFMFKSRQIWTWALLNYQHMGCQKIVYNQYLIFQLYDNTNKVIRRFFSKKIMYSFSILMEIILLGFASSIIHQY